MKYGRAASAGPECGVERTLSVIGGKWTTLVLRELLTGTRRYSDLKRTLGRVSPKTLTERLRHLEAEGLLTRTVYAEVPPRVEYTLTGRGEGLGEIIAAMGRWGAQNQAAPVSAGTSPLAQAVTERGAPGHPLPAG